MKVRIYPNDAGTVTLVVKPNRPGERKAQIRSKVSPEDLEATLSEMVEKVAPAPQRTPPEVY